MEFSTTHVVPEAGLASWPAPDPARAQGPLLPGRLEVQLLEWNGVWAHVRCSNGWTAWVDGRLLVARVMPLQPPPPQAGPTLLAPAPQPPVPPAPVPPAPVPPAPPPPSAGFGGGAGFLSSASAVGVGPLTLGGAALVLIAGFLPWYSFTGGGLTAWDLPVAFLLTGEDQLRSFKVGLALSASVAVVALPLVTRRPPPDRRLVPAAAATAAAAALVALVRLVVEDGPKPDVGVGLLLTVGGAVLIALEWRRGRTGPAAP